MGKGLKKPFDKQERHIQIPHRVLNSQAYIQLACHAKQLYVDLRIKYNGHNNADISATFSDLKKRGWRSSSTLSKALQQLQDHGLLVNTRRGGIASMSKVCSLYRFTDLDVFEVPKLGLSKSRATNDFENFTPQAKPEKKPKVLNPKLIASNIEAKGAFKASKSEADTLQ
jgi:hypothetical protein